MPQTVDDQNRARTVLGAIQGHRTLRWLWTEDDYGRESPIDSVDRVLTSALVILGDEEPVAGMAVLADNKSSARLVLFSPTLVLVWDVVNLQARGILTPVIVAPRTAIASLEVSTGLPLVWGDRLDDRERMLHWPGEVTVRATFDGVSGVVEVTGEGVDRYDFNPRPAVLQLLDGLVGDLRGRQGAGVSR